MKGNKKRKREKVSEDLLCPPTVNSDGSQANTPGGGLKEPNGQTVKRFAPRSGSQFRVGPSFIPQRPLGVLRTASGVDLNPIISARIDRGFHIENGQWIGYKRNYFTLVAAFDFKGGFNLNLLNQGINWSASEHSSLKENVLYFKLCLTGGVSESPEQQVRLIQHTAKRDHGPQMSPPVLNIIPGELPSHNVIRQIANIRNNVKVDMSNRLFFLDEETRCHLLKAGRSDFLGRYPRGEKVAVAARYDRIQFQFPAHINGSKPKENDRFILSLNLIAVLISGKEVTVASTATLTLTVRCRSPSTYIASAPKKADLKRLSTKPVKIEKRGYLAALNGSKDVAITTESNDVAVATENCDVGSTPKNNNVPETFPKECPLSVIDTNLLDKKVRKPSKPSFESLGSVIWGKARPCSSGKRKQFLVKLVLHSRQKILFQDNAQECDNVRAMEVNLSEKDHLKALNMSKQTEELSKIPGNLENIRHDTIVGPLEIDGRAYKNLKNRSFGTLTISSGLSSTDSYKWQFKKTNEIKYNCPDLQPTRALTSCERLHKAMKDYEAAKVDLEALSQLNNCNTLGWDNISDVWDRNFPYSLNIFEDVTTSTPLTTKIGLECQSTRPALCSTTVRCVHGMKRREKLTNLKLFVEQDFNDAEDLSFIRLRDGIEECKPLIRADKSNY